MIVHADWIWVHNPKCAGSLVRHHLFEGRGWEAFGPPWPKDWKRPQTTTHITQWELHDLFPEYFALFDRRPSFGITRDPYERFVSSYRYMRVRYSYPNPPLTLAEDLLRGPVEDFPHGRVAIEQHKMFFYKGRRRVTEIAKLADITDTVWRPCGLEIDMRGRSNVAPDSIKVEMTPELCRMVERVYAKDFELLGYECAR